MGTLLAQVFIWQTTLASGVDRFGTADALERYSRKSIIADWKTVCRFLQDWSAHCAKVRPGRAVASSKTAARMAKSLNTDPLRWLKKNVGREWAGSPEKSVGCVWSCQWDFRSLRSC